ncbi:phage tail protein [Serratia sp. S1B]|nr:phage tail protein [Serratia sp. S1B]
MAYDFMYSPSANAFYPTELADVYVEAGTWPADGIYVDVEIYQKYTDQPPVGKQRGANKKGEPTWVSIPPPTAEEKIKIAELTRSELRNAADVAISPLQDAVDLGIATGKETGQLKAWKTYRVLLSRIDTSTAPDIDWPVAPE